MLAKYARITMVLLSCLSTGKLMAMDGALVFRTATGTIQSKRLRLAIPPKWEGKIALSMPEGTIKTQWFDFLKGVANKDRVAIAFTALPGESEGSTLVLVGDYVPGDHFSGEVFHGPFAVPQTKGELGASLKAMMNHAPVDGFDLKGSFYFSGQAVVAKAEGKGKAAPAPAPVGRRIPYVTVSSGDSNNPCPNGPCWSTGGVGRHAEYYAGGPIQNPDHARPAAGFMRGLPSELTRDGQIAAQQVGIQRTQALYNHIDRYAQPGFGFFWGAW